MEIKLVGLRLKDGEGKPLDPAKAAFDFDVKALVAKLQKQRHKPSNWQVPFKNQIISAVPPGIWHHNFQRLQQSNVELYILLEGETTKPMGYQAFIQAADADIATTDRVQAVIIQVPLFEHQPWNMARLQCASRNFQQPTTIVNKAPERKQPAVDPFVDLENRFKQLAVGTGEGEEAKGGTPTAAHSR